MIAHTASVLIPSTDDGPPVAIPLPLGGVLPAGSLLVPWDEAFASEPPFASSAPDAITAAAAEAASVLCSGGDGLNCTWGSSIAAPVLFEASSDKHATDAYLSCGDAERRHRLANWGVIVPGVCDAMTQGSSTSTAATSGGQRLSASALSDAVLRGSAGHGVSVLLSPTATHALVAALLADWEGGDGVARLAAAAARGTKFVVARGPDAEAEAEARSVVESDLPAFLRAAFVFLSAHRPKG